MPAASISSTWSPRPAPQNLFEPVGSRYSTLPERKYQLFPSGPVVISIPYGSTSGRTDSGWKCVWTLTTGGIALTPYGCVFDRVGQETDAFDLDLDEVVRGDQER